MLCHYFATEDDIKCKINSYYVHAGSEQQLLFQLQAAATNSQLILNSN